MLEAEPGFVVLGEASHGEDALRFTEQLSPDIVLLDWAMPRMSGLAVLRELAGRTLRSYVIVLTASISAADIQKALQLGARGVVMKESGSLVLVRAIRGVMSGQYWIGRESLADLVQALRNVALPAPRATTRTTFGLTAREFQIVSAVAAAYANKDIAERFSISEKTVKHHLSHIFEKVGVSNRLELALFALNNKLEFADTDPTSQPH